MVEQKNNKENNLKPNKASQFWLRGVVIFAMVFAASPVLAQSDQSEAPIDLTKLVETPPDNQSVDDSSSSNITPTISTSSEDSDQENSAISAPASAPTSSLLTKKDPSSIRLGSLGLDREDVDGLGRLMWEGSDAAIILDLMRALDPSRTPRAFRPLLDHIMTANAVPPEGFIDIAPDIINARLNWLVATGASGDLAQMIRQLPEGEAWEDNKVWLILHDLMTRDDEAACRTAQKKVLGTLDPLWHQVNAFCAVTNGDDASATFALDILEDSGVDDPLYFSLMRGLINGDEIVIEDQNDVSPLNLALMDTARQTIEAAALKTLPPSYNGSAGSLRYLSPEASRLIGARQYAGNIKANDITQRWELLPRDGLSSAEALTRLRLVGAEEDLDADVVAITRLNAWHAIAAEKDELSKASLAFEAMIADYNQSGIQAITLWLPLIEGGINSAEIDAKIGPLMGFAHAPSKVLMNNQALAWHDLITPSRRPVSAANIDGASAYDAIPLITALGRSIADIDWSQSAIRGVALAEKGRSIPYAALIQIENTADQGRKAEAVLRMARLLQDHDLTELNRNDAAQLIAALMRLDMKETAQRLARDILVSWATDRHFSSLDVSNSENS